MTTSGAYQIEFLWKERVIYWEGSVGFELDAAWGVDPLVTYVPSPDRWDEVVPDWLRGRQPEVSERLTAHTAHEVRADPDFEAGTWRDLTR